MFKTKTTFSEPTDMINSWEQLSPWVEVFAKRYAGRSGNRLCWMDLYQEAWIILRFTKVPKELLSITAKRAIIKVLRKLGGEIGSHRNTRENATKSYTGETGVWYTISREPPVGQELETQDFLEKLTQDSLPEDRATVMAICSSGLTKAEAGRSLGVSRQQIDNRLKK